MGMHLTGIHLMDMHLMGVHLMGVHFMSVYLMGMRLTGMHLLTAEIINSRSNRCNLPVEVTCPELGTFDIKSAAKLTHFSNS
jgi:hypothetical protein